MLDPVSANRDTVQEPGVIGTYVDSFAAHQAACGYAPTTVRSQLKLLRYFNAWLIRRRCDIHQLNDERSTRLSEVASVADACTVATRRPSISFSPISARAARWSHPLLWSTSPRSASCSATTSST